MMQKKVDTVKQIPAELADEVFEAFHSLMHRFRAQRAAAMQEGDDSLTALEGRVLMFFARHPGATQRDLGEHTGRDKGQVARLVAGLRDRGLLDAEVDVADRRVTRLRLSGQGRAYAAAVKREQRRLSALSLSQLDADEAQQLLGLLQRVQDSLTPR